MYPIIFRYDDFLNKHHFFKYKSKSIYMSMYLFPLVMSVVCSATLAPCESGDPLSVKVTPRKTASNGVSVELSACVPDATPQCITPSETESIWVKDSPFGVRIGHGDAALTMVPDREKANSLPNVRMSDASPGGRSILVWDRRL